MSGRSDSAAAFWIPASVLYAVSLIVAIAHPPDGLAVLVIAGLALTVGAAIVFRTNRWNAWVLFTIGFVQLLFLSIPAAIRDFDASVGAFSLWPSVIVGALCATGGMGTALVQRRVSAEAFSFKTWLGWVSIAGRPLPKAEWVVKAASTLVSLWGLIQAVLHFL
jgi:hypothetical protein